MTIVMILIQKIISLFLILLAGVLLVKMKLVKKEDSKVLSLITLYLIVPCVIINAFQVDVTADILQGLLLSVVAAVLLMGMVLVLNLPLRKLLHLDSVEQGSVIYSNAGNLIIPLVSAMLGEEWVVYTTGYLCVQLVLLWSHGKAVICEDRKIDLKKILTNINMISVGIGLLLFFTGIRIQGPVKDAMSSLSSMVGPISMLVTGMLMGDIDLKKMLQKKRLWMITFLRLIFIPLLTLAFIKVLHLSSFAPEGRNILLISYLATITPSASTIVQMAQVYEKDADYASSINVLTTICCILTMPVMVYLYMVF